MGVLSASGKGAGVAAPLAVLISAVGIFALGWIVAQYAKRIHAAGSLYDYVSNGLGSTLGSAAGWLYYGGAIALTVGLGVFIGGFIHDTILTEFNKEPLPVWAWNVIWAVVLFFVLYLGVKLSTRLQLGLALVSMLVLLAFNIYVIAKVGSGNDLGKAFDPSGSTTGNLSGVLFGVLYGLLIFVGFETAANLAEETSQPKRQIPRAVLLSVAIVSVFYLIGSYTQVAGFHFSLETFSTPDVFLAPVFALGGQYSSTGTVRLLELIVLLDMMAVGIGAAVASTRGVFAMSRDRRLPGMLAKVSARFGTPAGAIVFLMVIQALLIWATQAWTSLFALPDTPALRGDLRVDVDVRGVRARGRVSDDVGRGSPRAPGSPESGRTVDRGAARHRRHRRGRVRSLLSGEEPDTARADVRRGPVRDRAGRGAPLQGSSTRADRPPGAPNASGVGDEAAGAPEGVPAARPEVP